ncbi:duf455-domain-containing protein [Phaffia rhodozyma]|uniref:Duf455-domain-containing protein n=1 Tax=Phaffia rhodozyma TaxID=264483 RepID=A0A0F7SHU1_PHARH|nr:duf455-domain-containing protein [Phaffia rhodozyma]
MTTFIPVGRLSTFLTHTRYTLLFQRYRPAHPSYKSHKLLLFRLSSLRDAVPEFYSMEATCPHLGADLGEADVEDTVITCPWHQYDFNLKDGSSETGMRLCVYQTKLEKDTLYVESPGGPQESDWELAKVEPVSEAFVEMGSPALQPQTAVELPSIESLSLSPPSTAHTTPEESLSPAHPLPTSILTYALQILQTSNPALKVTRTREALAFIRDPKNDQSRLVGREEAKWSAEVVGNDVPPREEGIGGTVAPGRMGKRGKGGSEKSRGLMLHALANIEQWAIDLAWDVIARFAVTEINGQSLPIEFYLDWAKVAEDEAKHFSLLVSLLNKRGIQYGQYPVHAGLWQSAQETSHSLRARLAIIHMVHEARGLDVNPITIEKFRKAGDLEAVQTLEIIHSDEVTRHKWFTWVCDLQNVDPVQAFRKEVRTNFHGKLKGPFNELDRGLAGMTPDFYEDLEGKGYDSDEERNIPSEDKGEIHPRLS